MGKNLPHEKSVRTPPYLLFSFLWGLLTSMSALFGIPYFSEFLAQPALFVLDWGLEQWLTRWLDIPSGPSGFAYGIFAMFFLNWAFYFTLYAVLLYGIHWRRTKSASSF